MNHNRTVISKGFVLGRATSGPRLDRLPTQSSAPDVESFSTFHGEGFHGADASNRVDPQIIDVESSSEDGVPGPRISKKQAAVAITAITVLVAAGLSPESDGRKTEAGAKSKDTASSAEYPDTDELVTCTGNCSLNADGLNLIAGFEGFRSEPYNDGTGTMTIGHGLTTIDGQEVTDDTPSITEAESLAIMQQQIESNYGAAVNEAFSDITLNQNQYNALVSLTYNVGTKWLTGSKLLDLIKANPNDPAIGDAIKEYCHAKGKVLQGLENRRAAEVNLYFTPIIVQETKYAGDNVEIFDQTDPRWKNAPFGTSTVGVSGCAPSALAMVINAMTDSHVTPDQVAAFATAHGQYAPGEGAYRTIPDVILPNWGLESEKITMTVDSVNQVLRDGGMVIVSGKDEEPNIPFTPGGHYIAIRGYAVDSDGKTWWLILDSAPGPDHNSWSLWDPNGIVDKANKETGGKNSVRAVTLKT